MSLNGIPYDVLENYPAGTPPPGVVPNFINPPSRDVLLIVVNTIFLTLMWSVVLMRLYAKARIMYAIGWDDYTCAMAAIASTLHSAFELDAIKLGLGKHVWDIRVTTLLSVHNVRMLQATSIIYPVCIYFVKVSILLLYIRIFGVYRSLRLWCQGAIVFFTLFYLAYFAVQAAFIADCVSAASLETSLCKNVYAVTVFQSAFNVASDVFVFALPIPRILKLQISPRQKFGLLIIFLAGLVACGVSIARLAVTAVTLDRADKLWYSGLSGALTCIEVNLAIIAACMSTLPGVLSHAKKYGSSVFRSLRSFLVTSRSGGTSNSSKKWGDSEPSGESNKGYTPSGTRKTGDSTYIQLEAGAKKSTGDSHHSGETLPPWGEP